MKHLKKYNENNNAFKYDDDIDLIKEIILELKHEYPSMEGDIFEEEYENNIYTIITIKPLPIYNEATNILDKLDKRMTEVLLIYG